MRFSFVVAPCTNAPAVDAEARKATPTETEVEDLMLFATLFVVGCGWVEV